MSAQDTALPAPAAASTAPHGPALTALIEQVQAARADRTTLAVRGGGSKAFYGEAPHADSATMCTTGLHGISSYEPSELVVTVCAGTKLAELEAVLADKGQHLPFEPPHFSGGHATVGGMVAAGLSGPSRPAAGSVRDHVLGATLLSGRAEVLVFGGQVMKNVAGYDVSRLLAGSLGTLGLIVEVSLKVLPIAPASATLRFELDQAAALKKLNDWAGQPLPVNASVWWDGQLVVRLRGALAAVQSARTRLGGERVDAELAAPFWEGLRDQRDPFFVDAEAAVRTGAALWRLSLPPTAPPLALAGELLLEWGGAQRWLCSTLPAEAVRAATQAAGGHATRFLSNNRAPGVFAPLSAPLARIHRQLKTAFDPDGVFNPGRLYPGL